MTTEMNDIQTKILSELAAIRDMLSIPSKKEKKPRKTRDPSLAAKAPNEWIVFTGRIRNILKSNKFTAGKEAQQFASHLKSLSTNAYSMTDAEILAARNTWNAPEKKEKEKEKENEKETVEEKEKEKEKKTVAKAKAKAKATVATVTEIEEVPVPIKQSLRPFPLKGKKYVWDPESNGLWLPGPNNTKGSWVGVLSSDRKTITTTA